MKSDLIVWLACLVFLFGAVMFLTKCENYDIRTTLTSYEIVEQIEENLVYFRFDNSPIFGSGTIVYHNDEQLILTAGHVVHQLTHDSRNVLVCRVSSLMDVPREHLCVDVIVGSGISMQDRGIDIAVIDTVADIPTSSPIILTSSALPRIGDEIWHGGYGGGNGNIIRGYISGRHSFYEVFVDADMWFGCSGGPVMDRRGNLMGVFTSVTIDPFTQPFEILVVDGQRVFTLIPPKLLDLI